jgi:hypothetical protein
LELNYLKIPISLFNQNKSHSVNMTDTVMAGGCFKLCIGCFVEKTGFLYLGIILLCLPFTEGRHIVLPRNSSANTTLSRAEHFCFKVQCLHILYVYIWWSVTYENNVTVTLTLKIKVKKVNFYQWYVVQCLINILVLCTSLILFVGYMLQNVAVCRIPIQDYCDFSFNCHGQIKLLSMV